MQHCLQLSPVYFAAPYFRYFKCGLSPDTSFNFQAQLFAMLWQTGRGHRILEGPILLKK